VADKVQAKHPGGRPSKLTPEAREKTAAYLQECIDNNKVPTAARLAITLGTNKSTLYEWAKHDQEFSNTLATLNSIQEATLVEGSLENRLNPTISKLMLANHGYKERQDITTDDDKIGVSLSADQAAQLIRARAERSDS
jgi:hypothetical protein